MLRLTIQKKITLTLSVLIFITVLSLGFIMNNHAREIVYTEVLRNNDEALSNVSEYYLHPYIRKMESVVGKWAEAPEITGPAANGVRSVPAEDLPAELKSVTDAWRGFISGNSEIKSIYYGSQNNGKLISDPSNLQLPENYDSRDRSWYWEAYRNPDQPYWSTAYTDAGNAGETVITVSKAAFNNGRPVGVVGMDIELSKLSELIKDIDSGESGYLMVLSKEGVVYAHPNPNMLNKKAGSSPWLKNVIEQNAGSDFFTGPDSQYSYSFLTIPETGWKLVSVKPVAIDGLLSDIGIWTIGAAVIAALIAILIAQLSARHMLKPVRSMMTVISGVSDGNMDSRMDIHSHDEFQVLGSRFNEMLDRINGLMNERDMSFNRLTQRNYEILLQKEEIQALHEETEAMNENLSELLDEIGENYQVTVRALANAIEASDRYTRGHCDRVGYYAIKLAELQGLSESDLKNLKYASMLHDVGKIGIPGSILNKSTPLTDEEFEVIRSHPQIGYDILMDVSFLGECRTILLQHHERMDGKGYPLRLKGEDIHRSAKILAIADSFDAMTSARAYRNTPLSVEAAIDQLVKGKWTQYDGDLVDAFVELCRDESQIITDDMAL